MLSERNYMPTPQEIVAGQMSVITSSLERKKYEPEPKFCFGDDCENDNCRCHDDEYGGDIPDDGYEDNVQAVVIH